MKKERIRGQFDYSARSGTVEPERSERKAANAIKLGHLAKQEKVTEAEIRVIQWLGGRGKREERAVNMMTLN
jgi:hypothetical protein